jgi:hypothetical protein
VVEQSLESILKQQKRAKKKQQTLCVQTCLHIALSGISRRKVQRDSVHLGSATRRTALEDEASSSGKDGAPPSIVGTKPCLCLVCVCIVCVRCVCWLVC